MLKQVIVEGADNTEIFQYEHPFYGLIATYACGIGNENGIGNEIIKILHQSGFKFNSSSLEEACNSEYNEAVNKPTRLATIRYLLKEIKMPITFEAIENSLIFSNPIESNLSN